MEAKFTPGPWKVEISDSWYPPQNQPDVYVASEHTVCTATVVATMGTYGGTSLAQKQCDAALIAAAPELYEALKDVNALIAEAAMTGFNYATGDWAQRLYDSQQKTSAALSRVEQTGKRDE